jgi:hypothetical protein
MTLGGSFGVQQRFEACNQLQMRITSSYTWLAEHNSVLPASFKPGGRCRQASMQGNGRYLHITSTKTFADQRTGFLQV